MPRLRLPSRALALKILGGIVVAVVVIAVVPPLRRGAALVASKVIVFVASPLAPDIADFDQLPETTKLVAVDGTTIAELDKSQRRVPIAVETLPDHVKQAVMAAEDQDFYDHDGVDASAVFRALVRSAQGRTQGGSTITQQLAKINYTARERTIFRKLKEVLYATKLEKRYTKDELLERYLNQIYLGDGAYGINAAAEAYFGKSADQLTPAEAAMIAGKIRAPEAIDPRTEPGPTKRRRDQVLRNMREEGWLAEAAFEEAVATPIAVSAPAADNDGLGKAAHFTEYVKREARGLDALGASPEARESQLFTGGYTVSTTFDPKVFDATVAAVDKRLGAPEDPFTAVATVVPGDGAIRSLFGGLDFATSQFDMSSLSGRQIGSAAKPFVYLAALRKGIDPRSTFDGTSGRVIPCYKADPVDNYAGEDLGGSITVDDALVHSVNVVFAELGCAAGPREVKRAATEAGIPEDASSDLGGYFLGGFDAKGSNALEMASAYATFAAKGVYAQPYSIAKIVDGDGNTVYEAKPKTKQVFKAEEVGVLNNPLQRVVKEGTGRNAAIGRPVAGKTGTTQDNIDAWFVGYTPQLATGVWVGYENRTERKSMVNIHGVRGVTGGSFPAQIFSDVMKAALAGVKVVPLPTASPDDLEVKSLTPTTAPNATTAPTSPSTTSTPTTTTTTPAQPGATTTVPPAPPRPTTTTAPTPTTTTTKKPPQGPTTTAPATTTSTLAVP